MNWLESIIYGLVSGISDFLPISSNAHQSLLLQLFGEVNRDFVRDLFVHLGILLSLYTGCAGLIDQFRRAQNLRRKGKQSHIGSANHLELRVVKNAATPMIIGILILSYISGGQLSLLWVSILLLINGIILFFPDRLIRANKDERTMTGFDNLLLGVSGSLSAFNGISRTGAMMSSLSAQGYARQKSINWVLLLSIPAIYTFIGIDVVRIISQFGVFPFWSNLGGYILSAISAHLGGYIGISMVKGLNQRSGFSGFAFYSWGAALFAFILYLTVV